MPRRLLLLLASLTLTFSLPARAQTPSLEALPPLPASVQENPYRQHPQAIALGQALFNHNCARCHGVDAVNKGQVGPDLTRLERSCLSLRDPEHRQLCIQDNDHFFYQSVLEGKRRVGVEHMPPWAGVLEPRAIWAIRSFVESRRSPPPGTAKPGQAGAP